MRHYLLLALIGVLAVGLLGAAVPAQPTIPFKVMRTVQHTNAYSSGLAWEINTIWCGYSFTNQIEQYDPYQGVKVRTITAPNSKVRDLAFDGTNLWMASWYSPPTPSIFTIDPVTGKTLKSFVAPFGGGKSNGMAWDGSMLWIGQEGGSIYQVDAKNWAIVHTIALPPNSGYNPRGLAWDTGAKAVWAIYQSQGDVIQYEPNTGKAVGMFKSPYTGTSQGLAWDGWYLWATGGNQTNLLHMSQIDVNPPFVEMKGTPKAGSTIHFELTQATGETGNLFVVGWSGSGTQGFYVGGKKVPLTFDSFTILGLALLPFFSNTVDGNGTSFTAQFSWPAMPSGISFWVCGVTLNQNGVVSVNEPFKFLSQ